MEISVVFLFFYLTFLSSTTAKFKCSFYLTVCKTSKKGKKKSHFVQLHSLDHNKSGCHKNNITNCTIMKECTFGHINSTLKIYIKLKRQHRESTFVFSISPTRVSPLASFTTNIWMKLNEALTKTGYQSIILKWRFEVGKKQKIQPLSSSSDFL